MSGCFTVNKDLLEGSQAQSGFQVLRGRRTGNKAAVSILLIPAWKDSAFLKLTGVRTEGLFPSRAGASCPFLHPARLAGGHRGLLHGVLHRGHKANRLPCCNSSTHAASCAPGEGNPDYITAFKWKTGPVVHR